MPLKQIRLDAEVVRLAEAHKPHLLETSQFIGLVVQKALTGVDPLSTLGKPNDNEVLPLKAVNKEKDVDFSLRAEEAHVPAAAIKSPPKATKEIPGNLFGHEDLIRAYWKAKPKTKTEAAWKLLMTELTKLQDTHGDSVVRSQLEQAEANRWQGITLANYERFGLPRSNTHQQASTVDWAAVEAVGSMF